MSKSPAMDLVLQFMGKQNTIPTPVPFIRLLGDHAAAAFLSQCLYWGERTDDPGGWFHKTHEEWQEELVLSPDQVRRCVRTCGPLVEVKRKGIPARNYYRANRSEVAAALARLAGDGEDATTENGEIQYQDVEKPNNRTRRNPTAVRGESPQQGVRETQHLRAEPTSEPTQNPQQKENTLAAGAAAGEPEAEVQKITEQTLGALSNPVQEQSSATADPATDTCSEKVPPAARAAVPGEASAPARRLSDAARIIAAWNDHRAGLPEVQGLNEGRKKAIKKLIRDCGGDIDRAVVLVTDATREVAQDDYWRTHRYGFDNLVPGKVFGRAEAWRSRQPAAASAQPGAAVPVPTTGIYRVGDRVTYRREGYTVEAVTDTYVDLYDDVNGSTRITLASSDWTAIKPVQGRN